MQLRLFLTLAVVAHQLSVPHAESIVASHLEMSMDGKVTSEAGSIWESPGSLVTALIRPLRIFFPPAAIFSSQIVAAGPASPAVKSSLEHTDEAWQGEDGHAGRRCDDCNKETQVHELHPELWPAESPLPFSVEMMIAFVWIGLVASAPIMLRTVDDHPVTRSQIVLAVLMWVTLFGGLYLFTNIILFQSGHFAELRPLTVVECIYMMSQVITTVGYGDITPAKPRGQVFVGLYVLLTVLVITVLVSELVSHILGGASTYHTEMVEQATEENGAQEITASLGVSKPPRPSAAPLVRSFVLFGFFAATWVVFMVFYPGENKTWAEAVYMSIITLSTVGFGAILPATQGGMVFAAFWMLFGSASLVNLIGAFTQFVAKTQEWESFSPAAGKQAFREFRDSIEGTAADEVDFMRFVLKQRGLCDDEHITALQRAYQTLTAETQGMIPGAKSSEDLKMHYKQADTRSMWKPAAEA